MTVDREREGMDRLRVGGWLSPARSRFERGAPPAETAAGPAHAAPDDGEPESRPPAPYEAPPVDFDAPVSAVPHRRAAPDRSRTFDTGPGLVANVGRYVYQGRRHLSEMMADGVRRQRIRFGLAGVTLLALAVAAVAILAPDGGSPAGQGLALPTGPPQAPPPSANQELGSASPEPPASPSPPRTTPPRTKTPPESRPGPLTLSYEAEDAVLIGGAEVLSLPEASGGRIVHNIGSEPGRRAGLISFTEVEVPATNRYALTVDYVSAEDRVAYLSINGEAGIQLKFPSSGGWDEVASRTFTIKLVGGPNNLTFGNSGDWAPRLDRISLLG